ncbi:hypothetical protein ACFUT3_30240 [Streptomyces cinereoruber]|uniref:hypothetical protein n=1 Tax=Streptomyces cinereoruber TaxID=67260 RepID=UPI00363A3172
MPPVTSAQRSYTFNFAEDIPYEVFELSPDVERTPELDQAALSYMAAKTAFYAAVNPGRILNTRSLDYAGSVVVSETTTENARLFPTDI